MAHAGTQVPGDLPIIADQEVEALVPYGGPTAGAGAGLPPLMATSLPDWTQLSAENAKSRRAAKAWLDSNPLSHLMAMRLLMEPLNHLLYHQLDKASSEWEMEGKAEMLEGGSPMQARKNSLLDYLSLEAEHTFFDLLKDTLHSPDWQHLDQDNFKISFESLLFRMSSRMGALVQDLLVAPTQRYPLALFSILQEGPPATQCVLNTKPCQLDSFTHYFLQKFPGAALVVPTGFGKVHHHHRLLWGQDITEGGRCSGLVEAREIHIGVSCFDDCPSAHRGQAEDKEEVLDPFEGWRDLWNALASRC